MQHTHYVVDVETDGPVAGLYSMVWLGVVRVDEVLDAAFEGKLRPISRRFSAQALSISGLCRADTLGFPTAANTMRAFTEWLKSTTEPGTTPRFWSDNNGFDWGFLSYYLWRYTGSNPFGHSSNNIQNCYSSLRSALATMGCTPPGLQPRSFEHLRRTVHDHNPVNDARGNAEALLQLRQYGLVLT